MSEPTLHRVNDYLWEIPRTGRMRVPARIYASEKMLPAILADRAAEQAANVAQLPGIVVASLAMPDIHWGYGFPIGGVAAFDLDEGIISPGGVGYDINCGVRLLTASITRDELAPHLERLLRMLFQTIPSGVGSEGGVKTTEKDLRQISVQGARWAVAAGFGTLEELEFIEEQGCIPGADPAEVSSRAWERGRGQVGTLGSGNHFLEIGYVAEIYDERIAQAFGLELNRVTVSVHCGSRGFGHQICDDFLSVMDRAARKYRIELADRQLACAPIRSEEGQAYLGAMRCAINYAFANRQVIAHKVCEAFARVLGDKTGAGLRTVYEIAHNIAKIETHVVAGKERRLCVHRKGATRAFAAGRPDVPACFRAVGQPVLIPGDMGRYSYVLVGTEQAMQNTFGSTCHGAGRLMSRHQAKRAAQGRNIARELAERGILILGQSRGTLEEEISEAYKDVSEVVETCDRAGLSRKVAQLRPLACMKG
ncbi:MAG: RtcB family protein [Kiritimatiellia bacterium]